MAGPGSGAGWPGGLRNGAGGGEKAKLSDLAMGSVSVSSRPSVRGSVRQCLGNMSCQLLTVASCLDQEKGETRGPTRETEIKN